MFEFDGKTILVIGLARTGFSVVRYALSKSRNVKIIVTDMKPEVSLPQEWQELKSKIYRSTFGKHKKEDFDEADAIFVSPGVDLNKIPFAPEFSKEIINDIELAYRDLDVDYIGITGSNGKSTTTSFTYELIKKKYPKNGEVILCGNYGIPILDELIKNPAPKTLVAELSSFQLENIVEFRPNISLLLNLSEDHLDRYGTYDAYIQAKMRIFMNNTPESIIIYNKDDLRVQKELKEVSGIKLGFSWKEPGEIFPKGKKLLAKHKLFGKKEFSLEKLFLRGKHNVENVMAGVLTALVYEVPGDAIQETIDTYKGIPHRIEFVRELNGVSYYNDSKATNVDSTEKALLSFEKNIILIAGGRDKGGSLNSLFPLIKERVKLIILIGEATERFESAFKDLTTILKCKTFEEAINKGHNEAVSKDVVLLSPACASYDMFKNYEERGDIFKRLVKELK